MNTERKSKEIKQPKAFKAALRKLEQSLEDAIREIDQSDYVVTNEDLGKLYIAYSKEDDGFYISGSGGNMEIEDGWSICFKDLALALWRRADNAQGTKEITNGLRSMIEMMEKWDKEYTGELRWAFDIAED